MNHKILTHGKLWMEGAAIAQLEHAANLPGQLFSVGLPDLHPGRGAPVGVAFLGDVLYPHLVGSDIGCGIALWRVSTGKTKIDPDKWAKKLRLDVPLGAEDALAALMDHGISIEQTWEPLMRGFGSIGRGNHFAEIGVVEHAVEGGGLNDGDVVIMVHSGSRSLGESVGEAHWAARGAGSLDPAAEAGQTWLRAQPVALAFAQANRAAIAQRILDQLGWDGEPVLDVFHNFAEQVTLTEEDWASIGLHVADPLALHWLTRKGAANARQNLVAIAASRGTSSAVFEPTPALFGTCGWTLAHGAGRKWARNECRGRLSGRFTAEELRRPTAKSRVICDNKDLLFEEAPQAYKDIEPVLSALEHAGAGRVVARLKPVLSYKTKDDCC